MDTDSNRQSVSGSGIGIRIRIQQLILSFLKTVEGCTRRRPVRPGTVQHLSVQPALLVLYLLASRRWSPSWCPPRGFRRRWGRRCRRTSTSRRWCTLPTRLSCSAFITPLGWPVSGCRRLCRPRPPCRRVVCLRCRNRLRRMPRCLLLLPGGRRWGSLLFLPSARIFQ